MADKTVFQMASRLAEQLPVVGACCPSIKVMTKFSVTVDESLLHTPPPMSRVTAGVQAFDNLDCRY